jgi:vancomycin permeability regulator SanA
LFLFSALLIGILILAIYLPGSDSIDNLTGKIIQLNTKGTKIILLSLFSILKVFITVSETVISFSALKKYYIFRSIWLTIFVVFTGLLIIFASIYYYKDDYNDIVSKGYKLDAGVVLGAAVWGGNRPSPVLRERINKGAELYYAGAVKNIVLTGGGAPGEMTEAEVAKNELLKKGVNEANIFIENKSNSTLEQVTYINQNLYRKNNWKEIALITDNFHLFRSKQICRFFGMNVKTVASDTPLSTESTFYYSVKESFAIVLFWLFGIG